MSSFITRANAKEPIEWKEKAYESVEKDSYMLDTAIALFAGLGVASFASPLAGAAIGLFLVKRIFDKESQKQKSKDLIVQKGLVAPFLHGDDFQDFVNQVGSPAVYQELKFADERGIQLSDRAWDLLEAYEAQHTQPAVSGSQSPVAVSQIGATTRLNAVEVQARTVTTAEALPVSSPVDYLVGDRLRTALVVSVSGGGKDVLLSNALRTFLSIYPGFNAIVMDCKDDPKEYGYYSDLPRVKVYRLNLAVSSDSTISAWIDAVLDDFNARPEKVLLLCNEGTLVREKSKRYADAVASLVSSGDSRQKYCWEAGQSGHADELKINSSARSRFRPLVIGMVGEEMQVEAILRAKWLADSANDMAAFRSEVRRSEVGRAWSDGQRWYAMPKLENYAGYNRDSRSFLPSREPKSGTPKEAALENDSIDVESEENDDLKSRLQSVFPNWSQSSIEVSMKVIDLLKRKEDGLKAHEIKSRIGELKGRDRKTTDSLLQKLTESNFVSLDEESFTLKMFKTDNNIDLDFLG